MKAMIYEVLEIKPAIKHFDGTNIHFEDGSVFENCDHVILNTGYRMHFPFLETIVPDFCSCPDVRTLWKHSFHPDLGSDIIWSGFARPAFGALPPCSEMQARYIAMVHSEQRHLPPKDIMQKLIDLEMEQELWQFHNAAKRVKGLVDYLIYMDGMAMLIGCYLNFWRLLHLLVTAPSTWFKVMWTPIGGVQFRLYGPNAKPAHVHKVLSRCMVSPLPDKGLLMIMGMFFWIGAKLGFTSCTRSGTGLEWKLTGVFAEGKKKYGWTPSGTKAPRT